jgi:serine/threonine protein kinase
VVSLKRKRLEKPIFKALPMTDLALVMLDWENEKMGTRKDWEQVAPLGGGGQSNVFLVRRPLRSTDRESNLKKIQGALDSAKSALLAESIWSYARPDNASELGALKVFKIKKRADDDQAIERLRNEIASLESGDPGLPLLLDSNVEERWLVTEYFPEKTLEHHPRRYMGDAARALKAFRSLVATTASLHKKGRVHRDIKPPNVFVRNDEELVLGDFGIVFVPEAAERLTATNERVGARDFMPQWADVGERLEKVDPNFDVYMLGKLLWCMVSGRQKLNREYFRNPNFDLTVAFPGDPGMEIINSILEKCVVEEPTKCLASGQELLELVNRFLSVLRRGGQLLGDSVKRPCRVCGEGFYQSDRDELASLSKYDPQSRPKGGMYVEFFVCNVCGHVELFKTKRRV